MRSVFFSFHYDDVSSFRANVVRNSWLTMDPRGKFIDKSAWEEAERKGAKQLKNLIAEWLTGTSVTIVLTGSDTWSRRWVKYEIFKSFSEGKGVIPIHINRIKGKDGKIKARGHNPLSRLGVLVNDDCTKLHFYELVDSKWKLFEDLPVINNRQSNSFHFTNGWFSSYKPGWYKLSDLFENEYDWVADNGYQNLAKWVSDAADEVGR